MKAKSAKRRLVFDKDTQLSQRTVKNNAKSWRDTLGYIKVVPIQYNNRLLINYLSAQLITVVF